MVSGCPQDHGGDIHSERGSKWSLEVWERTLERLRGSRKGGGNELAGKGKVKEA